MLLLFSLYSCFTFSSPCYCSSSFYVLHLLHLNPSFIIFSLFPFTFCPLLFFSTPFSRPILLSIFSLCGVSSFLPFFHFPFSSFVYNECTLPTVLTLTKVISQAATTTSAPLCVSLSVSVSVSHLSSSDVPHVLSLSLSPAGHKRSCLPVGCRNARPFDTLHALKKTPLIIHHQPNFFKSFSLPSQPSGVSDGGVERQIRTYFSLLQACLSFPT